MDWKRRIIPITLSLTLLIPTAIFANEDVEVTDKASGFARFGKIVTGRLLTGERSEEEKAKIEEVRAKFQSGEITREELMEQMKELMPDNFRIRVGEKGFGNRVELSEEVKAKIEELRSKLESKEITQEEFNAVMKEFMPENFLYKLKGLGNRIELSEEDKAKIEELKAKLESEEITRKEFNEAIKELMPDNFRIRVGEKGFGSRIELSEEIKAEIEDLQAKLESEEITKEEFKEAIKKLMP